MSGPKLFLIACEASGDTHGSKLIRELKNLSPSLECQGLGGPQMEKAGMQLHYDMTTISALGFGDVLRQYGTYHQIFHKTLHQAVQAQPDAIILIDSPAFNLRFAKKVRQRFPNTPLFYYICPQLWAWGLRRIQIVKENITKMFSILPFEVDFYKKHGIHCEFVGHPLLDEIPKNFDREAYRKKMGLDKNQKAVALVPGSRQKEVERIFPIMVQTASEIKKKDPDIIFFVSKCASIDHSLYEKWLHFYKIPIQLVEEDFQQFIMSMDFALVASGTATLQTALAMTPFFLLYKASWSTYVLGKQLIKVPYLGLVNLLAEKKVVPEFIQKEAQALKIAEETLRHFKNPQLFQEMKEEFLKIKELLNCGDEKSSRKAALAMIESLKS